MIDLVATHRLAGIELERSGFRLKVDGYPWGENAVPVAPSERSAAVPAVVAPPAAAAALPTVAVEAPSPPAAEAAPAGAAAAAAGDAHVVTSPIVGTFYRSPNPDAAPYADVGTRVKKGAVMCIIEAMKLMNEIEADVDGVVVEIYPKNAQAVEFGEPLFAIKTD